jgi:hypothetical protein
LLITLALLRKKLSQTYRHLVSNIIAFINFKMQKMSDLLKNMLLIYDSTKMIFPDKQATNNHRHDRYEIDPDIQPVQTGTPRFISELKTRIFCRYRTIQNLYISNL